MNFEVFTDTLRQEVQTALGEDWKVSLTRADKTNAVKRTGLLFKNPAGGVSPVFYLESYYEQYRDGRMDLKEAKRDILNTFHSQEEDRKNLDMAFFLDYEKVREGLVMKTVHREKNRQLLRDVPHLEVENLCLIPCFFFTKGCVNNGSILIKKEHLKHWQISEETLLKDAMENSEHLLPASILSMNSLLVEMGHPEYAEEDDSAFCPLYVLSNDRRLYGASCMFYPGVLKSFAQKLDHNLFLLPSSLHEIILVPDLSDSSGADPVYRIEDLLNMVTQINAMEVAPEEVLADAVYYYDKDREKLSILAEK